MQKTRHSAGITSEERVILESAHDILRLRPVRRCGMRHERLVRSNELPVINEFGQKIYVGQCDENRMHVGCPHLYNVEVSRTLTSAESIVARVLASHLISKEKIVDQFVQRLIGWDNTVRSIRCGSRSLDPEDAPTKAEIAKYEPDVQRDLGTIYAEIEEWRTSFMNEIQAVLEDSVTQLRNDNDI
jgi:hypothetical protein